MLNFCSQDLCDQITCDQLQHDSYPVENLVSPNPNPDPTVTISKAFMAERFVKPPINVKIVFKQPIAKLLAVKLTPVLGQQESRGIKIFAGKSADTACLLQLIGVYFRKLSLPKMPLVFGAKDFANSTSQEAFRHLALWTNRLKGEIDCVTIQVTSSIGIPVLQDVQILGLPSQTIAAKVGAPSLHAFVAQSSTEIVPKMLPKTDDGPEKDAVCPPSCSHADDTSAKKAIPDEFLDPITCEPMVLPILLPSGKTIDRATLERYVQEEARHARPPGDPYTGVPFSQNCKPIPNRRLKERLDQFFLNHPDLARDLQIGRTLCGGDYVAWPLQRGWKRPRDTVGSEAKREGVDKEGQKVARKMEEIGRDQQDQRDAESGPGTVAAQFRLTSFL